jgi:hypothetical protein
MLLGVYALHLVFFQALMEATPIHKSNNSFKPLFTHTNYQKKQNPQPPNHPAVTYYTMLMKQGSNIGGITNNVTPAAYQIATSILQAPTALLITFHTFQVGLTQLHVADDAFKLYRLIHVFLI